MADISVERKPRSRLPLILAILVIALLAAGAWWYYQGHDTDAGGAPAAGDTTGR